MISDIEAIKEEMKIYQKDCKDKYIEHEVAFENSKEELKQVC